MEKEKLLNEETAWSQGQPPAGHLPPTEGRAGERAVRPPFYLLSIIYLLEKKIQREILQNK